MMIGADQFCGFGGSSEGAKMAGYSVVWAGNHWPTAIQVHEINHQQTTHACEDITLTNYSEIPDIDFLMSSPECKGFSTASQPRRNAGHEKSRHLPWAVVQCLEVKRPEWLFVENVPRFLRWPAFNAWKKAIESFGYETETHILCATNHGVPQLRYRPFVIGRLGRKPNLHFTEADEIPVIGDFLEDTDKGWKPISKASKGDKGRFKAGREKCGRTFISQMTTGHKGVPLDEPIRTLTTQDHWKLVDGDNYRQLTVRELSRAMGFSKDYTIPDVGRTNSVIGFGNAVCPPVMRDILVQALG
mgnify:CR=1 FL=1